MNYSIDSINEDCYPNTTVLRNKFGILNEEELSQVEALISTVKIAQLEETPITGSFDFKHYCDIHYYIFSELFDWAGKVRTVDISKKGTNFCLAKDIEQQARLVFDRLKMKNWFKNERHNEFVKDIVDLYILTNDLHPFREGNGRAQRAFITQLIREANYTINFSQIDVDLLMIATIKSAAGVYDLLFEIFSNSIKNS